MSGLSLLLAVLATAQDPKPIDPPAVRAKRAAVVDEIINDRRRPEIRLSDVGLGVQRNAIRLEPAPEPAQDKVVIRQFGGTRRTKLLNLEEKADNPQPAGQGVAMKAREMALARENFDHWLFDDTRTFEGRRDHLGSILAEKIHEVAKMGGPIEPGDLTKLRLAGQGDIKRFLDRTEAARAEFEVARQDFAAGRLALTGLDPLAAEYRDGPFGAGSFFDKTLRTIVLGREADTPAGK